MKIKVAGIEIVIYNIDMDLIKDYTWRLNNGFLRGWVDGRMQYLHHLIAERMGLNVSKRIFRKNGNRLDFRRANLIDSSPSQESIRKNTFIDEWNMDLIRDYNWNLCNGYLYATIGGKRQYLHHIIAKRMGLDLSNEVDHIDRNPLNNRQSNLREATRSQNNMNKGIQSNNTPGYPGVCYDKQRKKWFAYIKIDYKRFWLGYHTKKKSAIKARKAAKIKYHREFAGE